VSGYFPDFSDFIVVKMLLVNDDYFLAYGEVALSKRDHDCSIEA